MTTPHIELATPTSPDHVDGVLNYLADKDQHPVSYNFKPPPGVPARTGTYAKFTVRYSQRPPDYERAVSRPPRLCGHASEYGGREFLRRR